MRPPSGNFGFYAVASGAALQAVSMSAARLVLFIFLVECDLSELCFLFSGRRESGGLVHEIFLKGVGRKGTKPLAINLK